MIEKTPTGDIYISHNSLKNPLTKIEITSTWNVPNPKVPTYSRTSKLSKRNSNLVGLLSLANFFDVHGSIINN